MSLKGCQLGLRGEMQPPALAWGGFVGFLRVEVFSGVILLGWFKGSSGLVLGLIMLDLG